MFAFLAAVRAHRVGEHELGARDGCPPVKRDRVILVPCPPQAPNGSAPCASGAARRWTRTTARRARPADELLGPAVEETLAALELGESDGAAAQLARQLARTIDQCRDQSWGYRWLGPYLLAVLEQLGATPAARARLKGGKPGERAPSQLDRLRAARRP